MGTGFDWEHGPDLNITPLVDIMLVLLAILMVTTPTLVYEEQIKLPQGSASISQDKIPKLEIRIDQQGQVYLKEDQFALAEFADNFMLYSQSFQKETRIYIRADERLRYKEVMFVMKSIKEAGFSKVSLVTDG